MEQVIAPLLNGGLSAVMAAAFIYFCWHVITRTIPEQRGEFLTSLREHNERYASERMELFERHERITTHLADAVNALTVEVRAARRERERE